MTKSIHYRKEIDGLRAIAVTAVILFHAGFHIFAGGFLGVDIFFVISGFLITGIVWQELEHGDFSLARFYTRRARRILPALLVVLLVSSVFALLWMLPGQIKDFSQSIFASLAFSANIYFWQTVDYFASSAFEIPLLHLWSLGVEEQYYVFLPLLLIVVARWNRKALLPILSAILLVSLLTSEVGWRIAPRANFYLLPSRAWELLAGACLSLLSRRLHNLQASRVWFAGPAALLGLILVIGSIFLFKESTPSPSLFVTVPVLGAALILAFASQQNLCGKLLSLPPMRLIGLISYSAYLWHQPIIAFSKIEPLVEPGRWMRPLTVVASFGAALLSWKFVEEPFRKAGKGKAAPLPVLWMGTAAVAVVAGGLLILQWVAPAMTPTYVRGMQLAGPEIVRYADKDRAAKDCGIRLEQGSPVHRCHLGIPGATNRIYLWGDSYSQALFSGLDQVARERNIGGEAYFIPGCPPVLGLSNPNTTGCSSDIHRRILSEIGHQPGGGIVFVYGNLLAANDAQLRIDGARSSTALVVTRLSEARVALNAQGKKLVIVEQGPRFKEAVAPFYLRDRLRGGNNELFTELKDRRDQDRAIDVYRPDADTLISSTGFFCDAINCPARDRAGRLIMRDGDHLTELYSRRFAQFLLDKGL